MNSISIFKGLVLAMAAVSLAGCSPARRPQIATVRVAGTVKLQGRALEGAQVNFLGQQYAGVATTDANGRYQLDAQPGENIVFVRKFEGVGPDFDETMMDSTSDAGGSAGPKQIVPAKYSDQTKTELKFSVPETGAENADFDLKK